MQTQKWYQSRTIQIAIIQGIVGVIVAFQDSGVALTGWILIVKSLLDGYVRTSTTKAIR